MNCFWSLIQSYQGNHRNLLYRRVSVSFGLILIAFLVGLPVLVESRSIRVPEQPELFSGMDQGDLSSLEDNPLLSPVPIKPLQTSNSGFTELWFDDISDHTYSVAWGDIDGDGDLDLATGNWNEINRIYTNDGEGTFTELTDALGYAEDDTYSVAWGDMDGDGDLDLAVGNDGVNRLYQNSSNGKFVELPNALGTTINDTRSVAWGDMDGDGDLDPRCWQQEQHQLFVPE